MRNKAKKILVLFMFTFIAFFLSHRTNAEEEPGVYRLPVFETSDVHGYMADDSGENIKYRMAWISDKIKDVKGYGAESRDDIAVLLDGGDIYQGNIMSSFYKGSTTSLYFEMMRYDAVTIGNHEFDWFLENVVDADGTMRDYEIGDKKGINDIPVIISNLYQDGEKIPNLQDYIILDKVARDDKGNELKVKVGVIGLAGDYGFSIKKKCFEDKKYSIVLDYDKINATAAELEESGQCDVTILLVHEMPMVIARSLGEGTKIDLVLGGHDHKMTNAETSWGLPYMEPMSNARAFAYSELVFTENEGDAVFDRVDNTKIVSISKDGTETFNTPENYDELDHEMVDLTDYVYQNLKAALEKEVGYITESTKRYDFIPGSGDRSDYADNWVTSIINRACDTEVTFLNGARVGFPLPEDSDRRIIYLSDVYEMFTFGDNLCIFKVTYGELLQALEYSFTPRGKYLLKSMVGIECHYNGGKVVSLVKNDGTLIYSNGVWVDDWENQELLVTANEYVATNERPNPDGGSSNPIYYWFNNGKMLNNDQTDLDAALDFLTNEAAENDGYLYTDRKAYYVYEAPAVKVKPEAKNLSYNGKLQELVTSGEATGGEMYFALGTDDVEAPEFDITSEETDKKWSTEIPKGENPGTYYVWYMVKGYDKNETVPECVTATIEKADQVINASDMQLKIGKSGKINATTSGDGDISYEIKSGDSVTLDKAGNVKAVKDGVTVITVNVSETDRYKAASKDIKVTVGDEAFVEMLRLYNPNSGEHFYTASKKEKDDLVKAGWKYEGLAWKAPEKSKTPVYRLYNPNAGDHHYTVSEAEKNNLVKAGWSYEGIGWYSDDAKKTAVYRAYNPNAISGAHHFTISEAEIKEIVAAGWKDEGIAWYGK